MKDISLDDEIKKDKVKFNKDKQAKHRGNDSGPRGRINKRGSNHPNSKPKFDRNQHNQKKPINKNRNQDRDNKIQGNGGKKFGRLNRNRKSEKNAEAKKIHQNKIAKIPKPEKKQAQEDAPKQEKGRTLQVLGLHPDVTNQELYKLFVAEGALEKCMIEQDNFGRNLPSAIVKYTTGDAAKQAIANNHGKKHLNSILTVEPFKQKR